MPSDFDRVSKQFHLAEFQANSLEFPDSLTSLYYTPSGSILLGDLQGKLHHVAVTDNAPSVMDEITVTAGARITDIATNFSGNVFASTSFGIDDVMLGEISRTSGKIGPTSSLQTRDRSHCVSFLEDHRSKQCLLLIGGRRGIRVHDFESGGLFRSFDSKCTFTSLHSWSGCMLMAGSLEGEVTLWDIRKPSAVATFGKRAASSGRSIFAVDSSARLLALASSDGNAEFYDISSQKLITKKKIIDGQIGSIAFSPKNKFLTVSDETKLNLLNLNEFSLNLLPFPTEEIVKLNKITGIRWSPRNVQFTTRSTDKKLRVFSLQNEDDL